MLRVLSVFVCLSVMLTAAATASTQVALANLQVYLPMDGNLNDASGNGHHGTLYDGADGGTAFVSDAIFGQSLDLEITNPAMNTRDAIRSANNDHVIINYGLPDSGTIAMWYKTGAYWHRGDTLWDTDTLQGSEIPVTDPLHNSSDFWECWMWEGDANMTFDARVAEGGAEGIVWGEPGSYIRSGPPAQELNTWYHVTLTWEKLDEQVSGGDPEHLYDAVELKMYLNGDLVNTVSNHPWRDPGDVLFLGGGNPSMNSAGTRFDNCPGTGAWDEVRIYDVCLTETQIGAVMNNADIPGDANCDGKVNGSDVTILAGNWQTLTGASWSMGDFNSDGKVDGSDVTILAGNWQAGVSTSAASVPEPSTIILLLAVMASWFVIRRR